jgi:hypothetical protein
MQNDFNNHGYEPQGPEYSGDPISLPTGRQAPQRGGLLSGRFFEAVLLFQQISGRHHELVQKLNIILKSALLSKNVMKRYSG